MAEEDSEFELEGFKKQLRSLFDSFLKGEHGPESKTYCAKFCKLVEECTGRWQEPLPQLRFLQNALCSFALGSACFPSDCEHVQCTLSSLALSVFELLLFFGPSDFLKSPLKDILDSIQECHSSFARHQNVHLLQVRQMIREGGSWASPTLHAILTEKELPGDEVDRYLGSEMPVFLELRVRYLMANQRLFEAVSLAKACAPHSTGRRLLFFLQVYLTFLWKASQHDQLHKVIAEVDAKDAVDLICYMETEDGDNELVLSLCRAFLSQQLQRGDMYYIWHLVFLWSKLQLRVNPSKQVLLDQSHQLMRYATNVRSIFPFMGVIMAEMGKEALQFCIELCIHALQSELSCDPSIKCLIYKTVAYLLPSDLDVCRACALLVFFLERSLEAYKTVFLLYTHPDQEYDAETSPVGNHVRFEILQVLKRGLYFDPEFWNLMALRTNCLKLMSEKVVDAALVEILEEEKWLPSCTKEPVCCWVSDPTTNELPTKPHTIHQVTAKKRLHKGDKKHVTKRVKTRQAKMEETELTVNHTATRRGKKPGPPPVRGVRCSTSPRRSFRQLDSTPENLTRQCVDRQHQHMTRLSEKKPPKRKIRKPRWLLEDSFTQAAPRKGKKPGRKPQQHHTAGVTKRSTSGVARSDAKQKTAVIPPILAGKELQTKCRKEFTAINSFAVCSLSSDQFLEVSQPDNELLGSFIEDTTNKLKSPEPSCEKLPIQPQQTKPQPNSEVIIRARDECSFIMKMHSYAQRSKVKCGLPIMGHQASDSTTTSVTCPSDHRGPHETTSVKPKDISVEVASLTQTSTVAEVPSKPHEGAVVPSGVPSADISSSDKSGQPNDSSYFSPSQNGIVHENTICANQVSIVHKKKSSKHMDPLIEALTEDNNSVPNVINYSDIHVSKDPTAKKCSVKVAQETIQTNELPTDAHITIVSDQPLQPFKNTTSPQEPADTENKAVKESMKTDTDPQASGFLTEKAKVDLGEAVDKDSNTPKQQMAVDTNSGISPENKTLVLHRASVLPSQNSSDQIMDQKRVPVTKSQKEPEPNTGTGLQDTQEVSPASPYHPTNGPPQDPEDSHLMHRCTLCDKVFRGKCVVAHATYHYSQDQCMFCGMRFKNDILAMMHLSEHIEKLKKGQVPLGGDLQENGAPKTSQAGRPTQSTSRRGRHKRSSLVSPGPTPSDSRKLRSSHKLTDTQSTDRTKKQFTKPKKEAVQRVNGHLRRRSLKIEVVSQPKGEETQRSGRQEENHYPESKEEAEELSTLVRVTRELRGDAALKQNVNNRETPCSSSIAVNKVRAKTGTLSRLQKMNKKRELITIENAISAQENVCCPVEGCPWPSSQPKNRQSLLNHAMEAHYGDAKPLELAFSLGNRRCSTCSRVCWSFQHYQDHVERHRDTPRHPCLHQGCGARFKSGGEMRRHTRRHSPLQAGCCFSGCTTLFACLWALNLHEREHYGRTTSTSATVNKTNKLGKRKKQKDTKDVKEQSGCKKDALTGSLLTSASNVNDKLKRAKVIKRVSVTELSVQTRKDSSVSASTPGKAVSASTPGKVVSASTPGKAVSASTPGKAVSASTPGKAVSASTPVKAVSASTPGKAVSASTPDKAVSASTPGKVVSASTPCKVVSASTPGKAVSASTPGKAVSASTPGKAVEDLHETQALSEKDSFSVSTSAVNTPATRKAQRIRLKRTAAKVALKLKIKNGRGRPTCVTSRKIGLKRKEVVNPQSANLVTSTDSPSTSSEETHKLEVRKELQETEIMDQQPHKKKDAFVVAQTSTVKVTDEVEMKQVNEECATQDKVTPTTPPSPSTKLAEKVQVNDKEIVKKPAAEHPSKASRKFATQVSNIKVNPNEVDPSNAPNKPANVKTPVSRKLPDNVTMEVASLVSLKTEVKPMVEASDSAVASPGYHLLNGHSESVKDSQTSLKGDTLSMEAKQHKPQPESSSEARKKTDGRYVGKKPYIRPPPTAYLDEKFTTMPKRRKISWSVPCSPKIETLQKAQRQRCVKCFSSFDRPEELQAHLELKKCTSLFGFDSDEEGNW